MIWDPAKAKENGISAADLSKFSCNLREAALVELARLNYSIDALQSLSSSNLRASDGSDWSKDQREKFHSDIFRFRRNIPSVAKSMEVPLVTCQAYYLGTYKSTQEYMLLKAICIDERYGNVSSTAQTFDVCAVCGDGGSLIICDGCEGEYHMHCLSPPLKAVPAGIWLCDECVDTKALQARDLLLGKPECFETAPSDARDSFSMELEQQDHNRVSPFNASPNLDQKLEHHPSQQLACIISSLNCRINEILHRPVD
jgi:PHD-finger